ncbi:MAG: hypothetical protein EXR77_18610 [Myxococcales bacterium]|nr:hypothetical protein [Myxococcales bacterium]
MAMLSTSQPSQPNFAALAVPRATRGGRRWVAVLTVTWVALAASAIWTAGDATAQGLAAAAGLEAASSVKKKAKPSEAFPLTGSVRISPYAPGGAFVAGEGRRTGFDLQFGMGVTWAIMPGLNLTATQNVNKNIVTNVDSGQARPYDTSISDTILALGWSPRFDDGTGKATPLTLPGGVRINFGLVANVPVSRSSKFLGRYTTLAPNFSLVKGGLFGGKLTLVTGFGVVNNFNKYTQSAVEPVGSDDVAVAVARPGGAEALSNGTIASGANITSFSVRSLGVVSVQVSERFSASLTYLLFNGFRYFDAPNDEFTGKYARVGRGRLDSQWGIASVNYQLDAEGIWNTSLYSFTASPPFSADGKTYRFPFFDFRSTSDNYTSIGCELSRSF